MPEATRLKQQCRFPDLADPYQTALREAVFYLIDRFHITGLIASGTIIRGNPSPGSDLDLFCVYEGDTRQRIQRFFNGVPCEMFVNPPRRVYQYFEDENRTGRQITAHMFSTGVVILNVDGVLDDLLTKATEMLNVSPQPDPQWLTIRRYIMADSIENALDLRYEKPDTAMLLLSSALKELVYYVFISQSKPIPRDKDLLDRLSEHDPALARLFHAFFSASGDERFVIVEQIADATIGTRGFFEWESAPEQV